MTFIQVHFHQKSNSAETEADPFSDDKLLQYGIATGVFWSLKLKNMISLFVLHVTQFPQIQHSDII